MRPTIFTLASVFLFFLFLTACTQMEFHPDTAVDSAATSRSTEAECNALEATWPPPAIDIYGECNFVAELLQCRLNQGVDEADVAANCTLIGSYSIPTSSTCFAVSDLLLNYPNIVADLKHRVYQETNGCPPALCPNPTIPEMCRIIIFSVSFAGDFCFNGKCKVIIEADVYCCF